MAVSITVDDNDLLRRLDWLMSTNLQARKDMRKLVREAMKDARKEVVAGAKSAVPNDPRAAYRAVHTAVYKRIIGGKVDILDNKKGTFRKGIGWAPARKLEEGQWGGNRRPRSARTEQIDSYYGSDRAFILRFVNAGTTLRETRYGKRGCISARNWFGPAGERGLRKAANKLHSLIEQAIKEVWYG
ncbi:MAG: hypothetical protein LUD72_03840 [Bacteroidales bacterium]|nr:hypothetical protein [Bacteroidales bacterium]